MTNYSPPISEKAFHGDPNGQRRAPTRPTSIDTGEKADGIDFRQLWHSILEKLWIVVIFVLAGLFLALGYLARTPKLYEGHVVFEVDVEEPSVMGNSDMSNRMRTAFLSSQDAMRTIEQNLTNRFLLARVIRSEGLVDDRGRTLLGETVKTAETQSATAAPTA